MITEDYVNYETAVLLKQKGFNVSTITAYNRYGGINYE